MPLHIQCPSCGNKGTAPDAAAGKKVKCPKCKQLLIVPAPSRAVTLFTPAVHHKPPVDSLEAEEDVPVISQEVVEDDQLVSLEAVESPYHPDYKPATLEGRSNLSLPDTPVVPAVPLVRPSLWLWWAIGGGATLLVASLAIVLLVLSSEPREDAHTDAGGRAVVNPPALPNAQMTKKPAEEVRGNALGDSLCREAWDAWKQAEAEAKQAGGQRAKAAQALLLAEKSRGRAASAVVGEKSKLQALTLLWQDKVDSVRQSWLSKIAQAEKTFKGQEGRVNKEFALGACPNNGSLTFV
jgi:hypothetical protein